MKLKKSDNKKKSIAIILSAAIIAVLIIPMLYSSIYLGSVWNVYGKLDKIPVAFVNMDKSIVIDGKKYMIGRQLESNLKHNKAVGWKFVSHEDALKGVEGTRYYAVVEIPEDFSKNIANVMKGKFKNPKIIYIANKGRNFIFSQVSSKVAESIKTELSTNIQKEVSKALVDSLYSVKASIKNAGDGTEKLQAGTQKLLEGSTRLSLGIGSALNGSSKLQNGLKSAWSASAKLHNGTEKLLAGSSNISNGLGVASAGSKKLLSGLKNIYDGQAQVVKGESALADGLKTFKSSLANSDSRTSELSKGASLLDANTDTISKGAKELDSSVSQLTQGIQQSDKLLHDELSVINSSNISVVDKFKLRLAISSLDYISTKNKAYNEEAPIIKVSGAVHKLSDGLGKLKNGTGKISYGVNTLINTVSATQTKAASAIDKLAAGTLKIQSGSNAILAGMNSAVNKTGELSKGLAKLNDGSVVLHKGLMAVNNGNLALESGLNTAAEKTGALSNGLNSLLKGSDSLKGGLSNANAGAVKLKDGLSEGYAQMKSKLKFNSDNMSKFISKPVYLDNKSINNVPYYGEGLAPYFISMSLWLGAMFTGLMFSVLKLKNVFKNKFMTGFIGKFAVGSVMVSFQSILLSFTLIKALGLSPVSISKFYIMNIFISLTFFSVIYGVSHAFGMLGAPIMFLVLLLQLSASGGTFPIETAPLFYRVINKVLPMTYSIQNLRMVLSGINSSVLNHNVIAMFAFIVVFLGGSLLIRLFTSIINKAKLEVIKTRTNI